MDDLQRHEHRQIRAGTQVAGTPTTAEAQSVVLAELGSALFASLPRRDQRHKGVEYVRGLLETDGRKSIRNIAIQIGDPAAEQSLHHFISDSTWGWGPVRLALARYLARTAPPQAWVIRPTVIPKAGEHSVGVGWHFDPDLGQALHAQLAVGVWAASEQMTGPVDWRLHLPGEWLDDRHRHRAAIPNGVGPETLSDCIVEAYLAMAARHELPPLPVVLDGRETDAARTIRSLRRAGVPTLIRINSTHRLVVADMALPGHSAEPLLAHQIMDAARRLRHPTSVSNGGPGSSTRVNLAAAVRVATRGGRGDLLLLGVGEAGRAWPAELWLTDLLDTPLSTLAQLAKLTQRVDRDFTEIADQVGIRDFVGRSFTGWHRHVTLASAAHAVAALARATGPAPGVSPCPQSRTA
jgi:syndecan 1